MINVFLNMVLIILQLSKENKVFLKSYSTLDQSDKKRMLKKKPEKFSSVEPEPFTRMYVNDHF